MSELYYERSTCRLCASGQLEMAMPLVATPVGDKYLPSDRRDETRETIPLDLYLCKSCGHLQTGAVVSAATIYKHYLSRPAAVNPVLSDAYRQYAEGIIADVHPSENGLIVELGSNDGAFLNFFKEQGMKVLGVDPAENLATAATNMGVETLPTFFSAELAAQIKAERGAASVIITNFAYANMDDLNDVTKGIRDLLAPDGVFMFETNYRVDIFQKHLLETINHEHLSYFAVMSLRDYFPRHGMELVNVEHVPSKGGSIRCTVQLAGGPRTVSANIQEHIANEESLGVYETGFYKACADHVQAAKEELGRILVKNGSQGKTFAGYGTSIGATIFTYQLGLGDSIKFFVDDDPYRQNLVSPGYHIPVVANQALFDEKPDYVLIMAPLYAEQIITKNQEYRDQGGQFIVIWPNIEIR